MWEMEQDCHREREFAASSRGNPVPYPGATSAMMLRRSTSQTYKCADTSTKSVCSNEDRSGKRLRHDGQCPEWVQDDYHGRYDCRDTVDVTVCSVGSLERALEMAQPAASRASADVLMCSYKYGETTHPLTGSDLGRRVLGTAQQDDIDFPQAHDATHMRPINIPSSVSMVHNP